MIILVTWCSFAFSYPQIRMFGASRGVLLFVCTCYLLLYPDIKSEHISFFYLRFCCNKSYNCSVANDDYTNFKKILSEHGYRLTQARLLTFKLLINAEPQAVSEILAKSKGLVDRASIYRNIELFEKLGIIHRIYVGWKYKLELSDEFVSHHHHLSCLKCGMIIDIEDEKHIDEFIVTLANKFSFAPRRHLFEVDGYCKNCQSQPATVS
jgi:Fur family zinc uptake transcriptional regulator